MPVCPQPVAFNMQVVGRATAECRHLSSVGAVHRIGVISGPVEYALLSRLRSVISLAVRVICVMSVISNPGLVVVLHHKINKEVALQST